ncbi:hypothetical protein [Mucilaginibacter sp.]
MKRSIIVILICSVLSITACKGNPSTQSGDSTGTGAGGARVPGNMSADTTKHDSTISSSKAMNTDSAKSK